MWKEFKEFAVKGNVLDLAVGVIIGGAFGKIVTSIVNDIIMPPIGWLVGNMDFSNLYINLSGKHYASLQKAESAGAATINYGAFLNNVLDFFIVAFTMFILTRQIYRFRKKEDKPVVTKDCPFCLNPIPIQATRCGHCTSILGGDTTDGQEHR